MHIILAKNRKNLALRLIHSGFCKWLRRRAIPAFAALFAFTNPAPAHEEIAQADNQLQATLWMQTAVEHDAITLQTFRAATLALKAALSDRHWSASLEQRKMGGYGKLPPAVVLDIDETVLDNSYYQARLIKKHAQFSPASWGAWVAEAAATPIPGALAFTRYAASQGVAVIYITNRGAASEAATRRNLETRGFPVAKGFDAVLMRGEKPAWKISDKSPRRAAVARRFRILLLLGDNLGDFMGGVHTTVPARQRLFAVHRKEWGRDWFALPNTEYGSWDGALYDYNYRLGENEKLAKKYQHLKTHP